MPQAEQKVCQHLSNGKGEGRNNELINKDAGKSNALLVRMTGLTQIRIPTDQQFFLQESERQSERFGFSAVITASNMSPAVIQAAYLSQFAANGPLDNLAAATHHDDNQNGSQNRKPEHKMKTRASLILLALALLTFRATAAPNGINIISNGDFENFVVANASFPPWQFQNGFKGYIDMASMVAHGGNCVFVAGQMWQDLNTEIGQAYRLSFYERGDEYGQSQRYSVLNVSWGNQQVASFIEDNKIWGWNYHEFTVVADSTITRLNFQQASGTVGSYGYPGVDFVSVVTIPEPSTMCLVGIAFAISFGNRFRARTRNRH